MPKNVILFDKSEIIATGMCGNFKFVREKLPYICEGFAPKWELYDRFKRIVEAHYPMRRLTIHFGGKPYVCNLQSVEQVDTFTGYVVVTHSGTDPMPNISAAQES